MPEKAGGSPHRGRAKAGAGKREPRSGGSWKQGIFRGPGVHGQTGARRWSGPAGAGPAGTRERARRPVVPTGRGAGSGVRPSRPRTGGGAPKRSSWAASRAVRRAPRSTAPPPRQPARTSVRSADSDVSRASTRAASSGPPAWPVSPPSTTQPRSSTALTAAAPSAMRSARASRKPPAGRRSAARTRAAPTGSPSRPGRRGRRLRGRTRSRGCGSPRPGEGVETAGAVRRRRQAARAGHREEADLAPPDARGAEVPSRDDAPTPLPAATDSTNDVTVPGRALAGLRDPRRVSSRSRPARAPAAARAGRPPGGACQAGRPAESRRTPAASVRPGAPTPTVCSRVAPASGHGSLQRARRPAPRPGPCPGPRRWARGRLGERGAQQVRDGDRHAAQPYVEGGEVGAAATIPYTRAFGPRRSAPVSPTTSTSPARRSRSRRSATVGTGQPVSCFNRPRSAALPPGAVAGRAGR